MCLILTSKDIVEIPAFAMFIFICKTYGWPWFRYSCILKLQYSNTVCSRCVQNLSPVAGWWTRAWHADRAITAGHAAGAALQAPRANVRRPGGGPPVTRRLTPAGRNPHCEW